MSFPGVRRAKLEQLGGFALLFCVTVIAFWPALHGGLVWDDEAHITKPALRSLDGLGRIWFDLGATQQYYPLLHTAFWVEHRLWGNAALGYHLVNVALHATAACLLVRVLQTLRIPGAWLAALIFALHPVSVESVAWITEQKSTLSAVFYLSSALLYFDFDRTRSRSRYFLALGLFLLALLSKTVTASLPAALLIVFWWQRGDLRWKQDITPLLPWFAAGACAGIFTAWVEHTHIIGAQSVEFALSPLQRVLLAGRALWFYPFKLIWPQNLVFIYPRWTLDPTVWWQYVFPLAAVALAAALMLLARRSRAPFAAFLFFSVTLFPALGFVNIYPFLFSFVADHFQYVASLGVIVPLAALLARFANQFVAAAALTLILGTLTWYHAATFRSAETLYRATLAGNPSCWMAHNNLGSILLSQPGGTPAATAEFQQALRLRPNYAAAENNLALTFLRTPGLEPQALAAFRSAIRMDPAFAPAHNNLGSLLSRQPGRLPDAIAEYEAALRASPDYTDAHRNLALALARSPGRESEAVDHVEAALQLDPDSPQTRRLARDLGVFQ